MFLVRVIGCALEMMTHCIFDVFHGDFSLGDSAPRHIIGVGTIVCVDTVPGVAVGIKVSLQNPCTGGVIDVVRVGMRTESVSGIEIAVKG